LDYCAASLDLAECRYQYRRLYKSGDQQRLKMAALEVVLGSALHLLGNRTQDHGPPPATEGKVSMRPNQP
jgi:hypothetical protein